MLSWEAGFCRSDTAEWRARQIVYNYDQNRLGYHKKKQTECLTGEGISVLVSWLSLHGEVQSHSKRLVSRSTLDYHGNTKMTDIDVVLMSLTAEERTSPQFLNYTCQSCGTLNHGLRTVTTATQ